MRIDALVLSVALAAGCASGPRVRTAATPIPLPKPPRPISNLVEELRAPDAANRAAAAWALAGAGTVEPDVLDALRTALLDPSEPVREAGTWALAHVAGRGFDVEALTDVPPRPLVLTRPRYPVAAYNRKLAGTVLVALLISATGQVVHAEIRESIPGLDAAALACVRDWQFEPARRAGQPVPCVATAPLTFRIY